MSMLRTLEAIGDSFGPQSGQRLRALDYPVRSVPGVAGGYRLGRGQALPPLLLDDDEAIAVVVSLRSAASHSVAGLSEASVSALAKLDLVLPARLRERTAALQEATVALSGSGPVIEPGQLAALAAACRRHQRLRLRYRNRSGSDSSRIVEPHRLVNADFTVLEPPELTEVISATAGRLRRACDTSASSA
jgi:predicted DNA-binding transcriptional regulator YafY